MDISQIKQLATVDGWVDFIGTITEVKESKSRTKKNRLMQKVKISDATDGIGAWIYADEQMFTPNQTIVGNGMLKEYNNTRYIDYATVKLSQQQPAPQQGQQAPSQSTGQPNAKPRDYDAENRGKCRTQFIKAAIISNQIKCISFRHVLQLTEFAMTGIDPADVPEPDSSIVEPQSKTFEGDVDQWNS